MATTALTRLLAEFTADLSGERVPEKVRTLLGDLLLDYIRVASIGVEMPWSHWAEDYVRGVAASGPSHVLFARQTLNPVHATFLNTTYAGSIDSDDTHVGSMLHPGSIVFSAALAIGQSRGAKGRDLLAAVAAGYEVMIRVALAIQPTHFKRGFQSTATCGGFGAGIAAARLLFSGGEASRRIAETLGMVSSFSGGLTQFYRSGSTVKRIHAAHAAESGVSSALMVASGFSGPTDILEGENGFARAYADGFDPSVALDGLGSAFRLEEVTVKGHAASARVLAAMEGMLELRARHGFSADDIRAMRIGIPRIIAGRLTIPHPVDMQAAQMSLPFAVALAAGVAAPTPDTSISMRDFEQGLRYPPDALQDRMAIEIDDEVEAQTTEESVPAKLDVELNSGEKLSIFVPAPRGSPSRPYQSEQHIARFIAELEPRLGAEVCDAIVAASRDLTQLDTGWLGEQLSSAKAQPRKVETVE